MSLPDLKKFEVWFVTGSQHLYGDETLKQVAAHSQKIVDSFARSKKIPVQVKFKPVVKSAEEIYNTCTQANTAKKLYWHHCMDAYLFAGKNVDRGTEDFTKTIVAFAHSIQPGYSME